MTIDTLSQLFLTDPAGTVKTGLRFVHFIGLALGLGGATLLDLMLLRFFLRSRIGEETFDVFRFSSRTIEIGLLVLWLSGLGFLLFYALHDPGKLTNPKVHAKFVIVSLLTLNGIFIHRHILPAIQAQIGKTLFEGLGPAERRIFVLSGAVSVVSWYLPVVLGVFSQLNYAVPAVGILSVYLLLIAIAAGALHLVIRAAPQGPRRYDLYPGE